MSHFRWFSLSTSFSDSYISIFKIYPTPSNLSDTFKIIFKSLSDTFKIYPTRILSFLKMVVLKMMVLKMVDILSDTFKTPKPSSRSIRHLQVTFTPVASHHLRAPAIDSHVTVPTNAARACVRTKSYVMLESYVTR